MNVLFLTSGLQNQMLDAVSDAKDITVICSELVPGYPYEEPDWVISYNYHHIVTDPFLSRWEGRIINIHTSYLPWNRGASPNLWAWYDDTPHGVTIHEMDEGIDTGPILVQQKVNIDRSFTLNESYNFLQLEAARLFFENWDAIKNHRLEHKRTRVTGSFHTSKQSRVLLGKFRQGYDTKCWEVSKAGEEERGRQASTSVSSGGGGQVAREESGENS